MKLCSDRLKPLLWYTYGETICAK